MARQKNPTALFDVIHSAKKPPKASPSAAIPTPKWWGKNKTLSKPAVSESTENVGKQRSWLSAAKKNVAGPQLAPQALVQQISPVKVPVEVADAAIEYWPSATQDAESSNSPAVESTLPDPVYTADPVASEPKPRFIDRFKNRAVKQEHEPVVGSLVVDSSVTDSLPAEIEPETAATEIKPERLPARARDERDAFVRVDSAAGDIRFRLSYAGLIAIGFVFVLLLVTAFLVGTRASQQASSDDGAAAVSDPAPSHTAGMMAAVGPTSPGAGIGANTANNPAANTGTSPGANAGTTPDPAANANDKTADPESPAAQQAVQPDVLSVPSHAQRQASAPAPNASPAAQLPIKKSRDIGMIYVVVQSYPEQELAQRACDFMNNSGVSCTLVQGPASWAPNDWYSVVGLQPFNKHDASLPDYERNVRVLGAKFTTRIIDQFQPQAYTWRADSDLSQP